MYLTLKIPKGISKSVPNSFELWMEVTGRVLNPELILVSSIEK